MTAREPGASLCPRRRCDHLPPRRPARRPRAPRAPRRIASGEGRARDGGLFRSHRGLDGSRSAMWGATERGRGGTGGAVCYGPGAGADRPARRSLRLARQAAGPGPGSGGRAVRAAAGAACPGPPPRHGDPGRPIDSDPTGPGGAARRRTSNRAEHRGFAGTRRPGLPAGNGPGHRRAPGGRARVDAALRRRRPGGVRRDSLTVADWSLASLARAC